MTAERRNAFVVVALVSSMTLGAAVLLLLAPPRYPWEGNPLLTAERRMAVREVEIAYAPADAAGESAAPDGLTDDTTCRITASGGCLWALGGPRVRLVVVGSEEAKLGERQKQALLDAVRSIFGRRGPEAVPVRLAVGADEELPAAVKDLRDFLVLKQIIK